MTRRPAPRPGECAKGHDLTLPAATSLDADGKTRCCECRRIRQRRRYEQQSGDSVTTHTVRQWARKQGMTVAATGTLPRVVVHAWNSAHPDGPYRQADR